METELEEKVMPDKISPPVAYDEHRNMKRHLKLLVDVFYNEFGSKRVIPRPKFRGKQVFVDLKTKSPSGHPKQFIHLIGFDKKEINFTERSVLACTNDDSSSSCNENCINKKCEFIECIYLNGEKKKKYPCLYRGARIIWINQIIELANKNSECVKVFEETFFYKGVPETDVHLRYIKGSIDYDVILKKQGNKYVLKTAFPVIYPEKKKDLDQKYTFYLSQQI